MDVLDDADSDFFHQHLPDDLRNAGLGTGVADRRTARISDDPDHARHAIFSGTAGQCLYPPGLAGVDGSGALDRHHYLRRLGDCRYALGVIRIEY